MTGKTIRNIHIGDKAEISKTVSETDIYLYAGITGDFNPAHLDETYARETFFKTRIAHGMLTAGFISAALANRLPGPGSIYLHQEMDFIAPVHIGDTITARVEVIEINAEKNRVRFRTHCYNQEGTCILDGAALVSPPREKSQEKNS